MLNFFDELTENIKNHDNIVIMTHSTPDLDGMGSALVFSEILNKMGKENVIVAPKKMINVSLNKTIDYLDSFIPFKFENSIEDNNSLLVIFDTQEVNLVECPDLLKTIEDKIVIDHHSKGLNLIKNTVCEFLDDSKSSTIEIICEYLKYLDMKLDEKFYTIMMAGIFIDTNGFNLKTTSRTFEIAAYLMNNGADMSIKQELLKDSIEVSLNRYTYIEKTRLIYEGVYLCEIDDRYCNNIELAQLADELLKFDGVKIAFAVGLDEKDVLISARSIDEIDVSKMMMKFGGGGHKGASAARVHDMDINEVIEKLKLIVRGENI